MTSRTATLVPPALLRSAATALVWLMAISAIEASAADRLSQLAPGGVKVGGEIGRRINVTVENNLLVLDVKRDFLQPFVDRKSTAGYIGLGKLIDSLVHMAAATDDPRVLQRKREVVAVALATQEPDGYLGLMVPASRVWKLWDTHEMSYLVYGLTNDYRLFGEKRSLEGAKKLADYIVRQCQAHPERELGEGQITSHMATTGLDNALLNLSEASGDARYRQFALLERKLPQWNLAIVCGRWGQIEGHAYAFLDHALAQSQLERTRHDEALLGQLRKAVDFLTRGNGLVITGTCGDHECWHDTQQGTTNLGESCTTTYLIRAMDDCLRREGDSRYGDIMERAIYNALFAAQSPDGRRIRYYTPFDGPRTYFDNDTYCCPCNYRRIVAELPGFVYYRSDDGLAVNLYTASKASADLGGTTVAIQQETDYPNSGRVLLRLDPSRPAEFTLRLRIPRWCRRATVAINGKADETVARPGAFLALKRLWNAGDRVELAMPMAWRLVKGRVAQAGRAAILRGPLVFCLAPKRQKNLGPMDLRLITLDTASIEGPLPDNSVRSGGMACRVKAWGPGSWYPMSARDLELTLTEYADPEGQAVYFNLPNPKAKDLVDDELVEP